MTDPVTHYARLVLADALPAPPALHDLIGETMPTCQFVKWACQRHLDDLEHGQERGIWWDPEAAGCATGFFPAMLRHVEGEWASRNEPITLELWQEFIVGSLWGWKRANGMRRFRTAYIELARKNAKSTMCAGLALLGTFYDGEGGAHGYCAATKRDQAKIVWNTAERMRRKSQAIKDKVGVYIGTSTLYDKSTNSTLTPLGAREDTLDGLNPHFVVIDELHAHPNDKVVQVLETGTGARSQPMMVEITTAGGDQTTVCWRHREHTRRILDPESDTIDDGWFGYVATVDEGIEWTDPVAWAMANPNLGVSVYVDQFAAACKRAQDMPSTAPGFKQKRLDLWVNASTHAIDMERWDDAGRLTDDGTLTLDMAALAGRKCYGGLDLARVNDLSAFVLVFPPDASTEEWRVLAWHWCPEDDIDIRSHRDKVPYRLWVDQGWIDATPGDVTDVAFIEERVLKLAEVYEIQEIAYDPTLAGTLTTHLQDEGLLMVQHRQGMLSMAGPTGEFLKLVHGRNLHHGGNPVLRWEADNLVVKTGPAGTTKPDKEKSHEKIDGVVAAIMAVGRAVVASKVPESGGVTFMQF